MKNLLLLLVGMLLSTTSASAEDVWAVVDESSGLVQNTIVWDGVSSYSPPAGTKLVIKKEYVTKGNKLDKDGNKVVVTTP